MKNHVTVTIGGQQYAILAAEGEEYVRKVAAYVDGKLKETMEGGKMALVDGAVLTAMNIADERFREQDASENLRRQIKSYLDEISDLKRQLFKAQNQQGHQQNRK